MSRYRHVLKYAVNIYIYLLNVIMNLYQLVSYMIFAVDITVKVKVFMIPVFTHCSCDVYVV